MIWLDNARIASIFAVVFLHAAAAPVTGSDLGSDYWWIGNLYDSLVRWCVPVFVMISGALLLDPSKEEGVGTFYRKRLSRLLLPVLFWSAVFLLWNALKGSIKGSPLSTGDLLSLLASGKPHYHLWFLYMIIPLYLFTPFFRKIIAGSTRRETGLFVAFAFLLAALNTLYAKFFSSDSGLFINWFVYYIPFFFAGYLIRMDEQIISLPILLSVFLGSSMLTAFGCYALSLRHGLETGMYFYDYLSITVIPMSVSIMYLLKRWTKPIKNENFTRTLSLLTLGVYLVHPIFLETLAQIGISPVHQYPLISVPIIASFVFGVSLLVSWVIQRIPGLHRTI